MYGDYYNLEETAVLLNLRYWQLRGMLTKPDLKCLFELLHIPTVDKLGRKIGRINLMFHKDNLEQAKEFVSMQTRFQKGKKLKNGWTASAIECRKLNGNCALCTVFRIIGVQCRMHDKVRQLLEEEKQREMQHGSSSASEGQNDNGNNTKSKKDTVCVGV